MDEAVIAAATLQSRGDTFLRYIAYVLMEKSLYLYYWSKLHVHIAAHWTFSALVDKAAEIITSVRIDDQVMKYLDVTPNDLIEMDIHDRASLSWIELICNFVPDTTNEEADAMVAFCNEFHTVVSMRMASHLQLTAQNMDRSTWLSARILSKDPVVAKEGAKLFYHQLTRLRDDEMTPYERAFSNDEILLQQLSDFCDLPQACCGWHKGRLFSLLFIFLDFTPANE